MSEVAIPLLARCAAAAGLPPAARADDGAPGTSHSLRTVLASLLLITMSVFAPASVRAQGGFGIDSGRASPSDMAHLAQDIAKVIIAEKLLAGENYSSNAPDRQSILHALNEERQREMMGAESNLSSGDVATDVRGWWLDHVLQPALDVAANPAASCSLARSMLVRILSVERQSQVLGLEGAFGAIGDGDSVMRTAFNRVRQRCLEEAFDECMATGGSQALIMALTTWRRQWDLLGITDDDWDDRVIYLMRRCTVYKVNYHMLLQDQRTHESAVLDGSYILLLHVPGGGDGATRINRSRWATRPQDPRDVQLTSLGCSRGATCRQSTPFKGGESCGVITMRRNVTERTFTVERNDPNHLRSSLLEGIAGVHVEFHSEHHREGENRLVLQFLPPQFLVEEKEPEEAYFFPSGNGSVLFDEAVQAGDAAPAADDPCPLAPLLINNDTWVAASHPTIFSTAHTAAHNGAQETTHFDIVHRPDLFPPDEIIPAYELKGPPEPPPRTPAR
jgi:hypothetical protein